MSLLAPIPVLKKQLLLTAAACVFTLAFLPASVHAEDSPFDLESSSWMSFDRYKEKPSNWMAPEERAQATLQSVVAPPPMPPLTMPLLTTETKQIVPPVLPGLNKGFDVKVNSTEDESGLSESARNNTDSQSDIKFDNKEWKDAVAAARRIAEQRKTGAAEEEPASSHIRFSALPNMPAPAHKAENAVAAAKKVEIVQPKAVPPPAAETPKQTVDPAICAALDAYKKRQLAAIESDRKTLTALQNAISQLGLQKKLDFIAGTTGALESQNTDKTGGDGFTLASPVKN